MFTSLGTLSHIFDSCSADLTDVFLSSLQEAQLAEALSNAEALQQRYSKQSREKSQLELEITTLNKSVTLFVHLLLVFAEAQPCLHNYNLLFFMWIMFWVIYDVCYILVSFEFLAFSFNLIVHQLLKYVWLGESHKACQ